MYVAQIVSKIINLSQQTMNRKRRRVQKTAFIVEGWLNLKHKPTECVDCIIEFVHVMSENQTIPLIYTNI